MISKKLNLPTVTIGIPAYNEEANIRYLLVDLLVQNQSTFRLEKIIVSSDASNDNTINEIKTINSPLIKIFKNTSRKGAAIRQNQIFDSCTSDIVVLLNADIIIKDKDYISKLIKPIIENTADLTSSYIGELSPSTFFEQIIFTSMHMKNEVFEYLYSGDNIYTCHGTSRAFAKKLYNRLRFKNSVGEDAYSYLFCKYFKFRYAYIKDAQIMYKLPNSYIDHERQSMRFLNSMKRFSKFFGQNFIDDEYHIPASILIKGFFSYFLKSPLFVTLYVIIFLMIKIKSLFMRNVQETWAISKSSKLLRYSI